MTYFFILHICIAASIYGLLGWASLKHQFVYAAWGIFYFEFLNYIEHYGLMRNKDKNGVYESINKLHSWNAVSSPLLFQSPKTLRPSCRFIQTILSIEKNGRRTMASLVIHDLPLGISYPASLVLVRKP